GLPVPSTSLPLRMTRSYSGSAAAAKLAHRKPTNSERMDYSLKLIKRNHHPKPRVLTSLTRELPLRLVLLEDQIFGTERARQREVSAAQDDQGISVGMFGQRFAAAVGKQNHLRRPFAAVAGEVGHAGLGDIPFLIRHASRLGTTN